MFKPYDAYEISRVHKFSDNAGGTFCEPVRDWDDYHCEEAIATFWTVYGHVEGEGVESIKDFDTNEQAVAFLSKILGVELPARGWYQALYMRDGHLCGTCGDWKDLGDANIGNRWTCYACQRAILSA